MWAVDVRREHRNWPFNMSRYGELLAILHDQRKQSIYSIYLESVSMYVQNSAPISLEGNIRLFSCQMLHMFASSSLPVSVTVLLRE